MNLWVSEHLGELNRSILGGMDMLDSREMARESSAREARESRKAPAAAGAPSRSRDCLGAYLAAISRIKLLTKEQEVELGPGYK